MNVIMTVNVTFIKFTVEYFTSLLLKKNSFIFSCTHQEILNYLNTIGIESHMKNDYSFKNDIFTMLNIFVC